jgi:predicted Abi (CAAX) family protease
MIARFKKGKPTPVEVIILSLVVISVAIKFRPQNQTINHQPSIKIEYSDH